MAQSFQEEALPAELAAEEKVPEDEMVKTHYYDSIVF
jgi:hypothetical protein